MSVHPVQEKKIWQNPWEGIDQLVRDTPHHPYARLRKEDIQSAFTEVLAFLDAAGAPYQRNPEFNSDVVTSLGTVKRTYCVPQTMWNGVMALNHKIPCLMVTFPNLKEFSAHQIVAVWTHRWPSLRAVDIPFPCSDKFGRLTTGEILAKLMESPANRENLIHAIRPHIENDRAVGLPAVLGISRSTEILADLEKNLGVPVFEIPAMPPSIPGLRLRTAFEQLAQLKGVRQHLQKQLLSVRPSSGSHFGLEIGGPSVEHTARAKALILATGRFLSGGLRSDRHKIREPLLGLPVSQPPRKEWHRKVLFDLRGHPLNSLGLEIDSYFRPLDPIGRPPFETLFAAGSILAHQDWIRTKCGAGLSIATAYGAVKSALSVMG